MRRIGTQVGCSAMAMYRHFESKEDLLMSICEETFTQVTKQREDNLTDTMEPVARLRTTMRISNDFGIRYPSRYKLVFMTDLSGSTVTERKSAIIDRSFNFYRVLVKDCVDRNGYRGDVDVIVEMLRAGVHGLISGTITKTLGLKSAIYEDTREQLIETLTKHLA